MVADVEGGVEAVSANDFSGKGMMALEAGVAGVGLAYLGLRFAGPPTDFVSYYNGTYANRNSPVDGLSP